jgi:hypothetical protein
MADVFISYKREDRGAIEQLADSFRKLGLEVWYDASLSAGDAFSDEIDREARASKVIVVCWSPASRESRWVKAEALIGFEDDKLAAAYVAGPDGFVAPAPFNSIHAEDMRSWLGAPSIRHPGWRSLLRKISRLCDRSDIAARIGLDGPKRLTKTSDVFAEAKPTYTLIDRSGTSEYRRIARELRTGGKIIRLHGPSKSGKTLLCRQVFSENKFIVIYGSEIDSRDAYWRLVAQEVGVPQAEAARFCAQEQIPLIIEDFHWIGRGPQAAIIKSFKPFLDRGGTAVLISVPDVAEVFLDQARIASKPDHELGDLLSKSVPVESPIWQEDDIRRIGELGFETLGAKVTEGTLNVLTRFSFRNPLLMQKHCSELCFNLGIDEALETDAPVSVTQEQLVDTFQRVASIDGAFFHRIATKGGKRPFHLATVKSVSLRELLLFAITKANINQKIGVTRVMKNAAKLLDTDSPKPDRGAVEKAFGDYIDDMRKAGQSGLVIDHNNYLYIAHPFFKSYLVWILGPHCGAQFPDLERYIEPSDSDQ